MSPAKQNYNIGNRELLAIKLVLEEWRHWLEGAQHPFEVVTDHKKLQYLREAKRLNPQQARWARFFTRFRFTVTYHPLGIRTSKQMLYHSFTNQIHYQILYPGTHSLTHSVRISNNMGCE